MQLRLGDRRARRLTGACRSFQTITQAVCPSSVNSTLDERRTVALDGGADLGAGSALKHGPGERAGWRAIGIETEVHYPAVLGVSRNGDVQVEGADGSMPHGLGGGDGRFHKPEQFLT